MWSLFVLTAFQKHPRLFRFPTSIYQFLNAIIHSLFRDISVLLTVMFPQLEYILIPSSEPIYIPHLSCHVSIDSGFL